jgi:hypothetical protein
MSVWQVCLSINQINTQQFRTLELRMHLQTTRSSVSQGSSANSSIVG